MTKQKNMKNKIDEKKLIEHIFSKYPSKRAATLPLLTLAQEKYGYISQEAVKWVAGLVDIAPMEVYETASFYTLYHTKPVGKNKMRLCRNISCSLLGAKKIAKKICNKLGVKKSGETSPDNKFHFETVECLGYCELAPVMQINEKTFGKVTEDKVDTILSEF